MSDAASAIDPPRSQVASTSRTVLPTRGEAGGLQPRPPQAPPFHLSRASKDIAFGSIAGMIAKVFEHPFDLVKVRLQTQPAERSPPMYSGAFDCFRQTYVKEGARGLFRGLSMPIFGATLENASLFFTYSFVQGKLRALEGLHSGQATTSSLEEDAERPLPMTHLGVAAACAGAVTSLVLTPVELIKCKMQVQMVTREVEVLAANAHTRAASLAASTSTPHGQMAGPAAMGRRAASTGAAAAPTALTAQELNKALAGLDGPVTILRNVLRQEGLRGLWLGQTGTLLRETGGGIAWFLAFEQATRMMIEAKQAKASDDAIITKKDLSSAQLVGAGALAGISYNVILFPADSVKSTMQTEREWSLSRAGTNSQGSTTVAAPAAEAYRPKGFIATFRDIYRTRGIRGLYTGCGVTCMRSAPSSALIFLLYNRLEGLADDYGI